MRLMRKDPIFFSLDNYNINDELFLHMFILVVVRCNIYGYIHE
jgi:hypothetical protein